MRVEKHFKSRIMNELHKNQEGQETFEPNEEQRGLLCSNICPSRCSSLCPSGNNFEKETIASLDELGKVLQRIHNRMVAEGYEIFEGRVHRKQALL